MADEGVSGVSGVEDEGVSGALGARRVGEGSGWDIGRSRGLVRAKVWGWVEEKWMRSIGIRETVRGLWDEDSYCYM